MTDIKSSLPEWCDDHWPATTYHHLTTTTSLLHSAASLVLQPSGDHQTGGWLAVGAQLLQFSRRIDWCLIQCQWPATIERERERESESQNVLNSRDTNRSTFMQQDTAASVSQTVYFFKYVLSIVDPVPTTNHDTVFTDSMKWNKCWMYRRGVEGLPGTSDSDYSDVVMVSWQKIDIRIAD